MVADFTYSVRMQSYYKQDIDLLIAYTYIYINQKNTKKNMNSSIKMDLYLTGRVSSRVIHNIIIMYNIMPIKRVKRTVCTRIAR